MNSNELSLKVLELLTAGRTSEAQELIPALRAAQEAEALELFEKTGNCEHSIQQGDNYGVSCKVCGQRLKGYGYFAHEKDCVHQWFDMGDESNMQVCTFCESFRPKPELN